MNNPIITLNKRLLRVREVALELGLCKTSIYNLINSGQLSSVKIGRSTRVTATAVQEYVAGLETARKV